LLAPLAAPVSDATGRPAAGPAPAGICAPRCGTTPSADIDGIARETGWLPYTVRGTMTNVLEKRPETTIVSRKIDGQLRRYRIA